MHAGFAQLLTLALATTGSPIANADFSIVEKDGVRIESSLKAHLYTWKITNNTDLPITRFEIPQEDTYNQQVPPGWSFSYENDLQFVATATDRHQGIQPGKTGVFTARGSSQGGLLTLQPASIGFGPYQDDIHFDAVWTVIAKPRSLNWIVAGTIGALALFHVWMIRRRPVRVPPATA